MTVDQSFCSSSFSGGVGSNLPQLEVNHTLALRIVGSIQSKPRISNTSSSLRGANNLESWRRVLEFYPIDTFFKIDNKMRLTSQNYQISSPLRWRKGQLLICRADWHRWDITQPTFPFLPIASDLVRTSLILTCDGWMDVNRCEFINLLAFLSPSNYSRPVRLRSSENQV